MRIVITMGHAIKAALLDLTKFGVVYVDDRAFAKQIAGASDVPAHVERMSRADHTEFWRIEIVREDKPDGTAR